MSETSAVPSMSVVIPVKDGERYLEELLDALAREGVDEILVIDSGSRDRSLQIVRAAGVELLEIDPAEFGHGRTRNLGAQRTSGELICFLTQDATPVPGWATAYREAFALDEHVGAAYGPHLPRPDTSPMIARELTEFFAGFEAHPPDGDRGSSALENGASGDSVHVPVYQRQGDPTFLSNVNACYARACWEEIRFREIAYSEDQAFGADMLEAGWIKVYQPSAAVLHAHDYGALEFMRRYFDEYRGLRESTGHVEPFGVLATARQVRAEVAGDRRWAAEQGLRGTEQASLTARSAVHHGGTARVLGARLARRPSAGARAQGACRWRAATTVLQPQPRASPPPRRVSQRMGRRTSRPTPRRASPRSRRPRRCRRSAITTTIRMSPASGARARRRCSIRCRGWPSASSCVWRS